MKDNIPIFAASPPRRLAASPPRRLAAFILFTLLYSLPVMDWNKLNAQTTCECPNWGLSISVPDAQILPFCEPLHINTNIYNPEPPSCVKDVIVRVWILTDSDPPSGYDFLRSFIYTGNLPVLLDEFVTTTSGLTARRFTFQVNDIPGESTATNLFSFEVEPTTFHLRDDYGLLVQAVHTDSECGEVADSEASFFLIEPRLTDPVISGTVTSLIDAGILLPNSSTSILVEKKTISGVLDVNTSYSFDGTGGIDGRPILYLLPGTSIIVRTGNTLTLTNADIFTCDTLAAGITVEPGATLLATGCTFSDCRFAIDAQPGSNVTVTGSQLFDNYVGMNFDMSSAPEASKRLATLVLSGNTYSTNQAAIKPPYSGMPEAVEARGYAGIRLVDYRDFNVYGGNDFARLANGIVGAKSTLNIGNMTFADMNSVGVKKYPQEGFGIYLNGKGGFYWANVNEMWTTMTFDDCKTAVYAHRYAGKVDNITATNVDIGIDWSESQTKDIRFRSNDITARRLGIASFLNEPLHPISAIDDNAIRITGNTGGSDPVTAIRLLENSAGFSFGGGWKVNRADITLNNGGRGIYYNTGAGGRLNANTVLNLAQPNNYTGIRVEGSRYAGITANTITQALSAGLGTADCIRSSGGWANTYQCNCLDNTNVGIQFLDLADFTNAVRGNSMNTHVTGLQVGDDGVGNAFIGRQFHTGNFWDLSQIPSGQFGGINWGNSASIIIKSEFRVNGAANPSLNPPVDPGSDWFVPESGNTFSGCATCTFPVQMPPQVPEDAAPTGLDDAALTGDLPAGAMQWKGQYRLYRKMLRQPALVNYSSAYSTFFDAQENQSAGQLAWIAEDQAALYDLSATSAATDSTYFNTLQQQNDDLRQLDSLRAAGSPVNAAQYAALVQQRATTGTNYAAFQQTQAQARQQRIQNLLQVNTLVSGTQAWVANHKTVNAIVLNYFLSDSLATGNLVTLTIIANQCPLTGGDAVYEARTFVAQLTDVDFDDRILCDGVGARSQPEQSRLGQATEPVVFYPNPTTGEVFWTGTGEQAVLVRVFNLTGQVVAEINSLSRRINLGNLADGLYLVQLLATDNTVLATQKLHVSH